MSEAVATTPESLFPGELQPPTGPATKLPALPTPTADLDSIRIFLEKVKEIIEVYEGIRGSKFDQVVTWRDCFKNGMVDLTVSGTRFTANPRTPIINLPTTSDFTPPPAPTGFTISAGMTTIILSWTAATYGNHAYTEIWRSNTNDLTTASQIGTTNSFAYADSVGFTGTNRYYWIRFVSQMNVKGPYNSATGTLGNTGLVGTADLTDLIITANKIAVSAVTTIKIANEAINSQKLADLSVIASKLADNSVTTSKISDASVVGAKLAALVITADKIASGAIDLGGAKITGLLANLNLAQITDATKIADSLITNTKLADLAVTASKIAAGTLTLTKFADGIEPVSIVTSVPSVKSTSTIFNTTNSKLYRWNGTSYIVSVATTDLSGEITSTQITDSAITSPKIATNAIIAGKIAAGVITSTEIAADTITAGNIAVGAITASELSAGAVTAGKIATNAIVANDGVIGNAAITNALIANLAVGSAQIADASITSAKIANLAVGTAAIADAAIISAKIADLAVGTAAIGTAAITAAKIDNLAVGNAAIANGAITNAKIGNLAVDAAKIADATIVTGKIADATITTAKIQDASISTAKIQAAAITNALIGTAAIGTANISDAAITNAKINDSIQSSDFSTGTAGWRIQKSGDAELNNATFRGTLNIKSAASGARTEMTNDVLKVFDSAGTLRVKIGNLSA